MSAAKMVADSTQGDSTTDSRKRKKKIKKSVAAKNKVVLPEDEDSDLDLKRILHPIGFYLKDRSTMIEEMFHSVRGASLQRALPELLKSMPLEELKDLCLEQLEVMSKKRIQRILAGEESANISSSGTDDMDDEEDVDSSDEDLSGGAAGVGGVVTDEVQSRDINVNNAGIQKREAGSDEGGPELAADSTSAVVNSSDQDQSHQSAGQQEGVDSGNVNVNNSDETDKQQEPPPPPIGEVYIKQEPPDSEPEQGRARHYRRRRSRSGSSDRSRSSSRSRSRSRSRSSSGSSYRRRRRRRRRRRSSSSSSSRSSRSGRSSEADKASLIEGGYEDPPEAYTSGSEDGELVRKEVVPKAPVVKQEVMSDVDDGGDGVVQSQDVDDKLTKVSTDSGQVNENIPDPTLATPSVDEIEGDLLALASTADTSGDKGDVEEGDDGDNDDDDDHDGDDDDEHKDTDGAVGENDGGSVAGGDESGDGDAGESSATPSVTMDHMELLELEMRARAIKAMLMTSSQAEEGSEKKSEGV